MNSLDRNITELSFKKASAKLNVEEKITEAESIDT